MLMLHGTCLLSEYLTGETEMFNKEAFDILCGNWVFNKSQHLGKHTWIDGVCNMQGLMMSHNGGKSKLAKGQVCQWLCS